MSAPPKFAPRTRIPSLCQHKGTGQAYVRIDGRFIYLGQFGSAETEQKYHRLIAEWLAGGRQMPVEPEQLTVQEMLARFWIHAEEYYASSPELPAYEPDKYRRAVKLLDELYGSTLAVSFGPLALQALRMQMINRGWCRHTINEMINRIKAVFRWATSQELLPASVFHALQSVVGLRRGRCKARESEPVRPVDLRLVDAVRPFVSRQINALIDLQLLTGARGGELLRLRPCDIDRNRSVWTYTPVSHKNAFRGKTRVIYFGPKAQDVLRPFLLRPAEAFLFSPAEAEKERREALHAVRKTPLTYGNRPGTHRAEEPRKKPGNHYTTKSYRRAIAQACDRAFPIPAQLAPQTDADGKRETVREWRKRLTPELRQQIRMFRKTHQWHPHQLRHTAATFIRREFGLEAAQIALGHSSALVTEAVYAERDAAKVEQIMLKIG